MGVIYSIACRDCKVVRDLDKFYVVDTHKIKNRDDAVKFSEERMPMAGNSFRATLLVSFMADHMGHDCVFFHEHLAVSDELDPFWDSNEFKEDTDFWG